MKLEEFAYELPPERIAQHPLPERDASRLLVLDRAQGELRHHFFRDLPELLEPNDLLVLNRSRVIPARLLGQRPGTGGWAEVFLLKRRQHDEWEALLRPASRLPPGAEIRIGPKLRAQVVSGPFGADGRRLVRFEAKGDLDELLASLGRTPLPRYVRRAASPEDRERYQTVFAREPGSVAAPTAGLHFTEALLARLAVRGVRRAEVVLHVGPATFRPVKVEDVTKHRVDPEPFLLPAETGDAIAAARERNGRVVCVGTTTVRTLEARSRDDRRVEPGAGETGCVIVPGFTFRVTDALVTNFHLPRSSLLLLVSAFAGRERILAAYREALKAGYRFYSYGDAMLIL